MDFREENELSQSKSNDIGAIRESYQNSDASPTKLLGYYHVTFIKRPCGHLLLFFLRISFGIVALLLSVSSLRPFHLRTDK